MKTYTYKHFVATYRISQITYSRRAKRAKKQMIIYW